MCLPALSHVSNEDTFSVFPTLRADTLGRQNPNRGDVPPSSCSPPAPGACCRNQIKLFLAQQNRKARETPLSQHLTRVQQMSTELEARMQMLIKTEKERKQKKKEQVEQERKEKEIANKKARRRAPPASSDDARSPARPRYAVAGQS